MRRKKIAHVCIRWSVCVSLCLSVRVVVGLIVIGKMCVCMCHDFVCVV